jgi:hypothetical protein
MSEERDSNPLVRRVDALIRRQQEDSQRAVQEVPLLTEVVEPGTAAAREVKKAEELLLEEIERALLVQLVPELNRQIAALRSDLEKELRKAVRQSVAHAIATRGKTGKN